MKIIFKKKSMMLVVLCVMAMTILAGCTSKSVSDKTIMEDVQYKSGVTDLYASTWVTMNIDSCEITEHKTTDYTDSVVCYVVCSDAGSDTMRYAYCYLNYNKYEQGWILENTDWEHDYTAYHPLS